MRDYEYIKAEVERRLSPKRFQHTLRVVSETEKLAIKHGVDVFKCKIAALVHDMAKNLSDEKLIEESLINNISIDRIQYSYPQLLHGHLAAEFSIKEFEIFDEEILNAIRYHTTGRSEMSLIEEIVYLADIIEEGRNFSGLEELRKTAYEDINKALFLSCNITIEYIIRRNLLIHPLTIDLRNSLLLTGRV